MKKNISGKAPVARTQLKTLLILGMLAGTASAQSPVTPVDCLPIPTLPGLVPTAGEPVPSAQRWHAGQHAAWILGLRTRRSLAAQTTPDTVSLPHLPPQLAADDSQLGQPTGAMPWQPPSLQPPSLQPPSFQPSSVQAANGQVANGQVANVQVANGGRYPGTVALPGPVSDDMVVPVQFAQEGLPEIPVRALKASPEAVKLSAPAVEASSSSSQPPRIGSGPIMAAPVAPLPLDEQPASWRAAAATAGMRVSGALVDGLVMPAAQVDRPESSALETDLPPIVTLSSLGAEVSSNKAKVTIHDGLSPRRSKGVNSATLSDGSSEPGECSPQLVKVAKSILSVADQAESVPTPAAIGGAQPSQPKTMPPAVKLSKPGTLAQVHAEASALTEASLRDQSSRKTSGEAGAKLPTSDPAPRARPVVETADRDQPIITQVPKLRLDNAMPAVAKMPVPESSLRGTPSRGAQAVQTASATLPSDLDLSPMDAEQRSFRRMAEQMSQAVEQKFPESCVRITADEDGLVVAGTVTDTHEASKIMAFVRKISLCPTADRLNCKR